MREKCPNTEVFLVLIFLYSDQKKTRISTLFLQWKANLNILMRLEMAGKAESKQNDLFSLWSIKLA